MSRRFAPLLLLLLSLAACNNTPNRTLVTDTRDTSALTLARPDELPDRLRVPLSRERGYLFVNGEVNGRRAGVMLFDTGSTLNIIDRGVVNRLGLEQVGGGTTLGVAGSAPFTTHRVRSLSIAGLDLGVDQAASLSMYKFTRGIRMNPAGLIGFTPFRSQPFTVDYNAQELIVYSRSSFKPPEGANKVRLYSFGGLPAVRATLANGTEVLLIIDTGADNAVTLPSQAAQWPGILATGTTGAGAARGVGGQVHTLRGWLRRIDLFGFNLGGVPVTFEPQADQLSRPDIAVGRIGNELLQGFRLTFDARTRSLWIEFAAPVETDAP